MPTFLIAILSWFGFAAILAPLVGVWLRQQGGEQRESTREGSDGERIRRHGNHITASRPRIAPEKRAEIIAALTENPNARHVANHIGGVSYQIVRKIAKAEGIQLVG